MKIAEKLPLKSEWNSERNKRHRSDQLSISWHWLDKENNNFYLKDRPKYYTFFCDHQVIIMR